MISVTALSFRTRDFVERLHLTRELINAPRCPIFPYLMSLQPPDDYFYEGKSE